MSNNPNYFLNNGGKMGAQLRAKDWSQTPLGSPETWPKNLQTVVSLVLNNPFAMYIAWGKEYTQIYNDGFSPILGKTKHPTAFGNSAKDTFSEVCHVLQPIISYVMNGKAIYLSDFALSLNRNGFFEDCYFDLSYSPIYLDDGKVGGTLVTVTETTEKKLAQDKVKESEERFKALADNIPNLAWMANGDGSIYWYNSKWYEYTGTTAEQMIGWGWQTVYSEQELEPILKEWNSSLRAGNSFEMIIPMKRADGINHQFLTRALPLRNEKGEITTWFGTNTDITAQKVAEEALSQSKKDLEFVIEAAQLGTFDYDPISNKFLANSRLREWFNLPSDTEINLSDAINVIMLQDKEKVIHAIEAALQYSSGGDYDSTYTIINPISKKEIILHAKGKALFNKKKQAYRLNGTVEDITIATVARKKLEQSENNLRLMVLQAPIAIAILRGENYIVEIANKSALEFWNKTEEQVNNISVFDALPEIEQQGIREILDDVRTTGQRFTTTELPLQINHFGKLKTVYINFSYEPLFDENDQITGIMALGFDVTKQVLARQDVERSEQSMRSLVESAPFPIGVYTGSEMRITLANQSMIEAWGKETDVIGKLYREILPELQNQNIYEQIGEVYRTGIAFHAKNQRVGIVKEGVLKYFYFHYSFTPLRDSNGEIYGVMNTAAEVTELNEAKLKIEESEKRFKDAVHQAPVAIAILKGKDNIAELANTSYLELVDKKAFEFLGKPIFETLPEIEEAIRPTFEEIYRTEKAFFGYEFPVQLLRAGVVGTFFFNFVYHPLQEAGIITGIIVIATDVTATVTAKKAMEENEQKLKIIIDASELGVWELDLETDDMKVSQRTLEILGLPNLTNITREALFNNIHPSDENIRHAAFATAFKTGVLNYEVRIVVNEIIYWIETKGKLFYDNLDKAVRIIGTIRDVSEEKNIQTQLIEREQKFRLLADSMPQFVWTATPEGKLNYWNQAVYDYSGYEKEEIIDKGWLSIVHDDELEENTRKWMMAISSEKQFLMEHRFRKSDGTYRWQLSRAIPQRDKEGKITMWVGTSTDIQDQKMFANELEKQVSERTKELYLKNEDLEKMNKELQSFAYISSHDLQEPLRKIQTFATQLTDSERNNLSDRGKDKFRRMQNAANRMQTLIQDLLAYSRTSIQERIFEKALLSSILNEVKEDLEHDKIDVDDAITIISDCELEVIPFQFRQLLFNLISNSLKFSKDDHSPKISIECTIDYGSVFPNDKLIDSKKYCHIKIEDNGIGFEKEYSEKIFEVFQRLHGKEKFDGTGIGLAIVKRIVDNHNGFIKADGVLNSGAVFNIYIPNSHH